MPRWTLILLLAMATGALADERLPAAIIRLPESTPTVFIAETGAAALHRFDRAGDGVGGAGSHYLSIGLGGTGKQRAGDQRTPLGIYFVTEQLDTSRLHEKYGVTAFPLDYPNAWDRRHGRTGDGIWVHGVDRDGGRRPPLDTDGCLALPNESLRELEPHFRPNVTPVVIGTAMAWSDTATLDALRAGLEQAVQRWAQALEQGDMVTWLDAYDAGFEHLGMNRDEWTALTLQTTAHREIRAVKISDLMLLADPVEDGLFLSRFLLEVREEGHPTVATVRRMYWRRSESGAFRIVAQDAG
jgi:hypothetical protein